MNVEAQKDYHPGYDLVTRGIFYVARMISAQMDVEFTADDYDGIKKVYSIQPEKIYGDFQGKAILRIRKKLFCRNMEMERERLESNYSSVPGSWYEQGADHSAIDGQM